MSKQIEGMNLEIKALADREWKYLTFSLENEEYGLHPRDGQGGRTSQDPTRY